MATSIQTSILIQASPERVWTVLTDFTSYPDWNPFVRSLKGTVKAGERIQVQLVPPGQKGMAFQPRVQVFEANRRFQWLGHLIFPGLFDGAHSFELVAQPDGTTLFIQSEAFKGMLVPFLKKMLNGPTAEGFRAMNAALKARVEQLS